MQLRRLTAEEAAVARYVEELWVPYNRDMAEVVERTGLAEDVDVVAEEISFRTDRLAEDDYELLVAVDDAVAGDGQRAGEVDEASVADADLLAGGVADAEGDLAGFVATAIDEAADVFARPDRLVVCDVYVRAPYRGTGLAASLVGRAGERARAEGCGEVVLDVDVDNDRALAFYEKLGFEPVRHRMAVDADAL